MRDTSRDAASAALDVAAHAAHQALVRAVPPSGHLRAQAESEVRVVCLLTLRPGNRRPALAQSVLEVRPVVIREQHVDILPSVAAHVRQVHGGATLRKRCSRQAPVFFPCAGRERRLRGDLALGEAASALRLAQRALCHVLFAHARLYLDEIGIVRREDVSRSRLRAVPVEFSLLARRERRALAERARGRRVRGNPRERGVLVVRCTRARGGRMRGARAENRGVHLRNQLVLPAMLAMHVRPAAATVRAPRGERGSKRRGRPAGLGRAAPRRPRRLVPAAVSAVRHRRGRRVPRPWHVAAERAAARARARLGMRRGLSDDANGRAYSSGRLKSTSCRVPTSEFQNALDAVEPGFRRFSGFQAFSRQSNRAVSTC